MGVRTELVEAPRITVPAGHFFAGQAQHLLLLALLLPGGYALAGSSLDGGTWLGVTDRTWFTACLGTAVAHQVLVTLVFRAQLCYAALTRLFGRWDMAVWGLVFFPFLIARPVLVLAVALADTGSLAVPRTTAVALALPLLALSAYTLWSVHAYFGFARAMGGDHFRKRYRHMKLVRNGAFRWSPNAMYGFAFLGLWAIGLLAGSRAALAAAAFQHAYIWVHMYCTEEPDMRVLYATRES